MTPRDKRSQPAEARILPTGWRVVGRGAERVAEIHASQAPGRVEPGKPEHALYALQCTMEPLINGRAAVERILDAITAEVRTTAPDAPQLLRDATVDVPSSRYGGLWLDFIQEPKRGWTGECVWRAVHPVVAGAPITTHVVIEERPGYTRLTVRVTADNGVPSVRGFVGAGQAQPAFLAGLRRDMTPVWMGGPLATQVLRDVDIADFVRSVLESDTRELPVVVMTPFEKGGFVLPPDDLMWDLLGRARLCIINDHRTTFRLSDAVGDARMSCFWGAARCYMPAWTPHDDPRDHPLLVADRLADPVMRAAWYGEMGMYAAEDVVMPASLEERRTAAAPKTARHATTDAALHAAPATTADAAPAEMTSHTNAASVTGDDAAAMQPARTERAAPPFPDPSPLIETLIGEVRGLGGLVGRLMDEVERLRTISAVRSSSTNAIERRLGRLEDILHEAFPDGSSRALAAEAPQEREREDDGRASGLVGIVQDAAESLTDALVFLPSALASAAASPYEDPERVHAIIEAMANVSRRRRDGALGSSLRDAFSDLGIDYRPAIAKSTSARLREQYHFADRNGELVEAVEHIALGNTYDPRRCLRIYFSSRVPNEPRFVIGHIGRHFDVKTTT